MDANRQRFWLLADAADWPGLTPEGPVTYDDPCRRLRLRSRGAPAPAGALTPALLNALLASASMAVDRFGTRAWWDAATQRVLADGAPGLPPMPQVLCGPLPGWEARDLALGDDDVLYVALQHPGTGRNYLRLIDRRGRWTLASADAAPGTFRGDLDLGAIVPHRVAAVPGGGAWVLDRNTGNLHLITGRPLTDGHPGLFAETVFRPIDENSHGLRTVADPLPPTFAAGERAVAIACGPDRRLALLTWLNATTQLRLRSADGQWAPPDVLTNAGLAGSVTWLSETTLAVLPAIAAPPDAADEALVFELEPDPRLGRVRPVPAGGFHPLRNPGLRLFAQGPVTPPRYLDASSTPQPLLPLSVAAYAVTGTTTARVLDAGSDGAVWHRMYLEADLPSQCGVLVELAATDDPAAAPAATEWFPHHFGDQPETVPGDGPAPQGAWLRDRSELPHHPGLLNATPEPGRCGLFTVLIQRTGRRVRALAGRYLHVRTTLIGTGHASPEIAALRVYGPRFSYRDHYLPELYREDLFGADANQAGAATPADFLDRFLALFESALTPLEDRVAQAHVLMDPRSAPDEALEWLGTWIGVVFDPTFPTDRRRAWLSAAHRLFQTRGTLAGLQLAIEIATGGRWVRKSVDGREIEYPDGGDASTGRALVIEDFRLRRTFATILGADLSDADDPLLPGLLFSTQSMVGDTLILGDEQRREFLALFRHLTPLKGAAAALYDRLAFRATVLVHDAVQPVDFGLLRRVVAQQAPAHVEVRVERATWPLLVGLASLVGVDTFLGPPRPRGTVRLGSPPADGTRLGENAFVQHAPSLDPRVIS